MARGVISRRGILQNNSKKAGLLAAAVAGVFATGVLTARSARADLYAWDTTRSGGWGVASNWILSAPAGTATDQLVFAGTGSVAYTSTVDAFMNPWIINGIFLGSDSTATQTINNSNTLGFQLSGTTPFIEQQRSGAFNISSPIALGAATTFRASGTGTGLTTLSGVISGSNSLTVSGGNWRLTNTGNSWTGGTTITGGVLELFSNGADIPFPNTGTSRSGNGGTVTINATTPGGPAELRFTSGLGKTLAGTVASKPIIFGPNGGLVNIDGSIANFTTGTGAVPSIFNVTTSNVAGAAPAVFRFNGGPNHLSGNSTTSSDWRNADNALRMSVTNSGPIRVELLQGAMLVTPNVASLPNPLTVRGVLGGDPSSGPNGTVHTGITQTAGRFDLPSQATYTYAGGLTLGDSLLVAQEGAARAIKGNITIAGTASGHPGNVGFFGRSTGTALGPTLQLPGQNAAGLNPLYIGNGFDPNDSLTIQDGGIAALDLRVRSDQNNHNGVLLNARTIINAGGKLVFRQSISAQTPGLNPAPTAAPVGFHIVQGNIQGEGTTAKESIIDLYMPGDNTVGDGATTGGVDWQATSNLIVNGSGTGGLRVNGLSRPSALFGGGSNTDPDPNNQKVEAFLSASRLAALTGSGGYLTPAPVGTTFNMAAGSDWVPSVTVGLRVVDSNTTGDDVALGGNFTHNILVDSGATLNADQRTLGPSTATLGIGRIWGGGTIRGVVTVDAGGRIAPGTSVGTLTAANDLTINGTYEAEVTDPSADLLNVGGTLTLGPSSVLDLPVSNTYGYAPYTIATYASLNGTFGSVNGIPNGPSGPLYGVDYSNGQIRLVFIAAQQKTWSGSDGAHPTFWDNNTTANWNGGAAKYIDANHDNVTFDDSANSANVVVTGGNVLPSSILVNNNGLNYTITSSAGNAIAGTTGLEKRGNGKLTLSGPNSFTGSVRIKQGTVSVNQLTDAGVAGPLGTNSQIVLGDSALGGEGTLQYTGAADGSTNRSVTVNSPGGIFDVTNNVTATYSGVVSGDGTLYKRGAGTAALSGAANTFTGVISAEQGTLRVGSMGVGTTQIALGNGVTEGTFDYAGPTFTDNRSLVGVGTMRVSNAATNFTLSGPVSAPTIKKTGPGTLTLSGLVNLSDTVHTVAQGTLSLTNSSNNIASGATITVPNGATLQSRAGAIGGANVRLSGGVLRTSADDAGLYGEFFLTGVGLVTPDNTGVNAGGSSIYNTVGGINTFLSTLSTSAAALTSATGTPVAFPPNSAGNGNPLAPWNQSIGNDYLTGRWKGKINLPTTGQYTFYLASDDGSVMFIDGVKVADLNRLAGYSELAGTPVNLSAGVHDIMLAWYENAGGAGIDASWLPPGGVKANLPNNILLASANNASTSFGSNSVQVISDSTIDAANTNNSMFAGLTMEPGITLTHTGVGATRFNNTTLNGAGGSNYNFNVAGGVLDLGQLNNTAARIINKSGAGNLVLVSNGGNGLAPGSSLNVSGGNVVAVGQGGLPAVLGNARINFNAGATGLIISSKGGNLDFNNPITVDENVRIAASASDGGVSGPLTVNLNSLIGVNNGKTLTLAADDGYTLNVLGDINGSGGITVAAGDGLVDMNSSQTTGTLAVNAGTAQFSSSQTATVAASVGGLANGNYAVVNGNALLSTPQLTIGNRGTYNANIPAAISGNVAVNTAGTLNANFANALSGATVTASGGNVQFWVDGAIGTGSVTLSNNGSITGRVAETAADPANVRILPTFAVAAGQTGNLAADRDGAAAGVPGLVIAPVSNLGAGSILNFVANNNTSIRAQQVNLSGASGTTNNNVGSPRVSIGNVSGASSQYNVMGTGRTRITGNINASNVVITGAALDLDPGASGTSTVSGPVQVLSELKASSGTINIGNNVISGDSTRSVPGLNAYFYQLAASEMQPSPFPPAATYFATLSALNAKYTDTQPVAPYVASTTLVQSLTWPFIADTAGNPPGATFGNMGWTGINNYTVVFRGQMLLNGASTTFFTNSDDATMIYLAGNNTAVVDNNGNHGAQTRTGTTTLTGWQDVVLGYYAATGTDGGRFAIGADADANAITNAILRTPSASGSFGGVVNVESGVQLTAGGVSDLGTINFNGSSAPASVTLASSSAQSGTVSNVNVSGTGVLTLGANNTVTAENLTVPDGAIFEKQGAGTLRVSIGQNLGNGATLGISAGKVLFNGVGAGNGSVIVRGGATAGGSGSVAGTVSVQTNGHLAPGASVGTLTVAGLDLNNSILDIEGGAAGLDKIKIASDGTSDVFTLTGNTTISLSDLGGVAAGDYVIIDYNNLNPINDALNHLHIGNPNGFAGLSATLLNDTTNQDIVLHMCACGGVNQWNADANGSWGLASNWIPNAVPDGPGAIGNFLGKITAPRTITLDGNRTVSNLNFDNANTYTIAPGTGGTLTVLSAISVTSGSHVISAPLAVGDNASISGAGTLTASGGLSIAAGKTFTKSGSGTLSVSGVQAHGAGSTLKVSGGVLNLNSNAGGGTAGTSPLSLNIIGGAGGTSRVNLGSNQDLANLSISIADAGSQTLNLASPAAAGAFNGINVYAADLNAAKASLSSAIVNANKAGAADPLDGIIDSGKHASSGIGIATLGDHVSIRSTRIGDLNLDGNVSISDFIDLASNFGSVGTATWQEGDLNYDNNVSISDFIDLASNFGASYAGAAGVVSASDVQTLASFASSIGVDPSVIGSAVPEPGTLGLLAVGAMGLIARRRRKI